MSAGCKGPFHIAMPSSTGDHNLVSRPMHFHCAWPARGVADDRIRPANLGDPPVLQMRDGIVLSAIDRAAVATLLNMAPAGSGLARLGVARRGAWSLRFTLLGRSCTRSLCRRRLARSLLDRSWR